MQRSLNRLGRLLLLCLCIAATSTLLSQQEPRDTLEHALSTFLSAFDNLDWPLFRSCFSDHPTMFHPAGPDFRRVDSPGQFDAAWHRVFERIQRESGRAKPPYMHIPPEDLRIERLSADVTLVTFQMEDHAMLSRRTLIFPHHADGWKIVHIHASNGRMH
jgi:ketosteroid isomerase-like protein